MKVILISYTKNCEQLIACSAKLCYSDATVANLVDEETKKDSAKFVRMLQNLGHESPLEHANFTFGVEGVSRSCLAQITRHRIASFSVQSQRYVAETDFTFVTPPEIENLEECKNIFLDFVDNSKCTYNKLLEFLKKHHKKKLLQSGLTDKEAEKKAEKLSCEDARFVLPNACCCKFIMTMNARSLLHFFKLRCCNRAQWEIRNLATKMLKLVLNVAPNVFKGAGPACVRGNCTEGRMSCGLMDEVRIKFNSL